ncbi:MAG: putative metal-binding motif-containing protein [Desulforhopalus sp.]
MNKKFLSCLLGTAGALLLTATNSFSFGSFGDTVNNACAPVVVYNGDCSLCHVADRGASTPARNAAGAGGSTLTSFFCPPTGPTCTDNDGDSFATEGGECGPVDCNDNDAAINPDAAENCTDNLDNNCNGLIDVQDPSAVGCLVCTDGDGDTFSVEGGDCGAVDCDDSNAAINPDATDIANNGIDEDCSGADTVDPTSVDNDGDSYTQAGGDCNDSDASINPGAFDVPNNGIDEDCDGVDSVDTANIDNDGDGFTPVTGDCDDTDGSINPNAIEVCSDAIDNNCNGLVDIQDPNAVDCPVTCIDNDGDTYAVDNGDCGPVDCNDTDSAINPGVEEVCGDNVDNDCDGSVDEGCDITCPDADGDGYEDATCGGTDCNDNDPAVNPAIAEICGNDVDENCNGTSDDVCLTCPDGSLLAIKEMEYNRGDQKLHIKGRATVGTTISIINADTDETLAGGIRVREGKWEAEIKSVGSRLKNITVISSNGCGLDQAVDSEDGDDDDRKGGRHDDDRKKDRDNDDRKKDRDDDKEDRKKKQKKHRYND